mmetsp:Transcript_58416/g.103888  ORF Transcript_58416/g.103888 Transcript_58416/m.103888 type:complete len:115 (-) Transcript_58416:8-352(-)
MSSFCFAAKSTSVSMRSVLPVRCCGDSRLLPRMALLAVLTGSGKVPDHPLSDFWICNRRCVMSSGGWAPELAKEQASTSAMPPKQINKGDKIEEADLKAIVNLISQSFEIILKQ